MKWDGLLVTARPSGSAEDDLEASAGRPRQAPESAASGGLPEALPADIETQLTASLARLDQLHTPSQPTDASM